MKMNKQSEAFDVAGELACCLSREPVPMALLIEDLGLKGQAELRGLLDAVRELGVRLRTRRMLKGEGIGVEVVGEDWPRLRAAAAEYWRRVWFDATVERRAA